MKLVNKIKVFLYKCFNLKSPNYPYMIEPCHLALLINEIDKLQDKPSSIIEIGAFRGMTTRFLCEHITSQELNNIHYWVIDTFNSFVKKDIDYEVTHRGKNRSSISSGFLVNDFITFKNNFKQYSFLNVIKGNCSEINYEVMKPIRLVVLDVDLYLPTKKALNEVFALMEDDGVIIVDDVMNNNRWDGAYQAYFEFCNEQNIIPEITGKKTGIIRKSNINKQN